jgi:hypothetical protein
MTPPFDLPATLRMLRCLVSDADQLSTRLPEHARKGGAEGGYAHRISVAARDFATAMKLTLAEMPAAADPFVK